MLDLKGFEPVVHFLAFVMLTALSGTIFVIWSWGDVLSDAQARGKQRATRPVVLFSIAVFWAPVLGFAHYVVVPWQIRFAEVFGRITVSGIIWDSLLMVGFILLIVSRLLSGSGPGIKAVRIGATVQFVLALLGFAGIATGLLTPF
jgi:hypothetical protein